MIVVKLEIWPYGVEANARSLGKIEVHNDGTGSISRGNYLYKLRGQKSRLMSRGEIKDYARNAQHPWNLIRRILKDWRDEDGTQGPNQQRSGP